MSDRPQYNPPKVWALDVANDGQSVNLNRLVSGATHEQELPVGKQPLQLYSMGTPNGVKVTVMLEELLALGHNGAEYDAWLIHIGQGDQFSSGFVDINPNSKIPALVDRSAEPIIRVFESGSILLYLAEKFSAFLSQDLQERTETLNWLFWQMGSASSIGAGFGHFYAYAPEKQEYPINRFAMETKRLLHLLNTTLAGRAYVAGNSYTIADIAIWPWYAGLVRNSLYGAAEFLSADDYPHVQRWGQVIAQRPAVQRGNRVNRVWGEESERVVERHSASDFDSVEG